MSTLDLVIATCKRCGHSWIKRVRNPRVCPSCKSPYWNKKRTRLVSKKKEVQLAEVTE